jgi:hypothetical protein
MPAVNSNNPFNFPQNCGTGPGWAQGQIGNQGAQSTDHDVQVGCNNTADNWGTPNNNAIYNSQNDGNDQTSSDLCGDPTVVNTAVQFNPNFVADNLFTGQGSIGLYGRSRGAGTTPNVPPQPLACPTAGAPQSPLNDWSIGVLGQSSKGCGVYGLATDDFPNIPPPGFRSQPSHGIGVVGRSVGGEAPELVSVEQNMCWVAPDANDGAIGVLGQSSHGPGVRGHGGPLQTFFDPKVIPAGDIPPGNPAPPAQANPGGVFSSGRREYRTIGFVDLIQEVSPDSFPQLRLTPSVGATLPRSGQLGDFFLRITDPGTNPVVTLYLCTGHVEQQVAGLKPGEKPVLLPQWSPVTLGAPVTAP